MPKFLASCAVLTILLAIQTPAHATVTLGALNRSVSAQATPHGAGASTTAAGSFIASASAHNPAQNPTASASAALTSDIQTILFSGTGQAHSSDSDDSVENSVAAESLYTVRFTLDREYCYDLRGRLTSSVDGGEAGATLILFDSDTFAIESQYIAIGNILSDTAFSETGLLDPGNYFLSVRAATGSGGLGDTSVQDIGPNTFSWGDATFDFTLQLKDCSVPEPVTAGLSIMGLSALALAATRRRRA